VIGERVERKEDRRFLTGGGRYVADVAVPGALQVAILRSPLAHARIGRIDTAAAEALDGVHVVCTGDGLAAVSEPFTHRIPGPEVQPLSWYALARDAVRYVGEPVVAVAATSRAVAEDALELVEVDYEPLAAVVDPLAALEEGAPLLYPEWGTNVLFRTGFATGGVEEALRSAPHRRSARLTSHRVTGAPLEGHGAAAAFDRSAGRLTLWASSQQPHQLRTVVAEVTRLGEAAVRVVAPDMGGGFGNKQHFGREEVLVALMALACDRPVRWLEDRVESLTASPHARAQVHDVEVGFDRTGRVLALRNRIVSDLGNPVLYFSGIGPSLVAAGSVTGGYAIAEVAVEVACVATTTCPVGAYRGFGQPEAHLTTERVMDLVAGELGLDPVEVRRRNLLPDAPRPWRSAAGAAIDVGRLGPQLDRLVAEADYVGLRRRQQAARAAGRLFGIGVSTLVQGTAPTQHDVAGRFGSWEAAAVDVLPDGRVRVRVGTKSQGQGHATVMAQLAASVLQVPLDRIDVVDGDTDALAYGMGTWGSRSAVMGGGAVLEAAGRVLDQLRTVAAGMLGGAPGDVVMAEGGFAVAGVEAAPVSFEAVAAEAWWHTNRLAPGTAPGLGAVAHYTPGRTLPGAEGGTNHDETYGSHMSLVAVEVDRLTGEVRFVEAVAVVDCGTVINPTVVEGQLQGGFAQGVGLAVTEEVTYTDDGQPTATTLLDYCLPEAADVPVLKVVLRPTPSGTAGGFRGVGETAIIFGPVALVGAVNDALAPLGIAVDSTRCHPHHLRPLLHAASP
jgi:carbon-monoxide dehydrogenase large subunit